MLREIYSPIGGSGIPGLLADPNFPDNPFSAGIISDFEAPESFGPNYGQRIRGWVRAPQTGTYSFWIASEDQGQLFLSSSDRPENSRMVAQVLGASEPHSYETEGNQRSLPITLSEGQFSYIEALMANADGPDHISVRWQLPDGRIEDPIPNNRVFVELIPPLILQQPRSVSVEEGSPATFSFQVSNRGAIGIQWLRNDIPILGATNLTYTIPAAAAGENGTRFRVSLTNDFATNAILSDPVFLSVRPDVTAPLLLGAQTSGENGLLIVTYSEPVDPTSGTNAANYTISGGVQVQSAAIDPQGRTVILRTTPLVFGQNYLITVNHVTDRARQPNTIDEDSSAEFRFDFKPLSPETVYGKFEAPGPSTRRTGLTISEIMYHPAPRKDARNLEFIEIYNSDPEIVNLGGFRLSGVVEYTFPDGSFLAANSYAVVAAVPLDMQTISGLSRVYGPFNGDLVANGTLRLLNDQGAVLLEVPYESGGDWPSAADGAGPSLVLARPSYGERDPRAWDASQFVGGSPGKAETIGVNPFRGLVINEFFANTDLPQVDFIELYNYGSQEIDISGVYITDDITTNKFRIPSGTRIAPLGFISFDEKALGFGLDSSGERIILRNPQQTRVLESIKFDAQANGISTGRFPDGNPRVRRLAQPTPGTGNSRSLGSPIVINEIMYHPISGNEDEEYIELYNRSTAPVNLNGWRLSDGVSYTFTQDTTLAPGAYLVIAKNVDLLRSNYSNTLTVANSAGNFDGALSNGGERISLERPELSFETNGTRRVTNVLHIVENTVRYRTGGQWPRWTDGGGSSLELIDADSNNEEASNWADSDETQKSSWLTIERRGILDYGLTNLSAANPTRNLHVLLCDAGEALLDNVQVMRDGGPNLLRNPGFENGLADWQAGGTHEDSTLELDGGHNGGNALHIRAVQRGDTASNRLRARLTQGLTNGTYLTIRADARWLRGSPDILLRLHGNYLELAGSMPVPKNLGTPGTANSRAVLNSPPVVTAVQHNPLLPARGQDVEVRARIEDADRIGGAALYYRVDPSTNYTRVSMAYRGAGYYSGTIPGQISFATVAFYVEALDGAGNAGRFPVNAPQSTGVIFFDDLPPSGGLPVYRLWLTQTNIDRWTVRERSSNKPVDATFVYNGERAVYNMGTLYSGSPFHWLSYDGPTSFPANYVMVFPPDDLLFGQTDFVLNLPSNLGSDPTAIREQTFFWMVDQLNMPFNYRRYHQLYLNGFDRGESFGGLLLLEDSQQPNRDFVEQWYPNDADGELYKIEDWFEFDENPFFGGFGNRDGELTAVVTTNLATGLPELKKERYRWWFRKRAVHGSAHDYTELFKLVRAVNNADPNRFVAETQALIDVEEWMGAIALRHVVADWDSYGYGRGKNMYAYKPKNGKWQLLHWDMAFGFGGSTQSGLFDARDEITRRMFQTPVFRRAYYRALDRVVNGPFIAARINAVIDTKFGGLVKNGIGVQSAETVKQWIAERREFIVSQLANVSAGFALTSNRNYSTNRNTVILSGSAPVGVKTIKVNDAEYPVTWTSETGWELRYALKPQQNIVRVQGYDANGLPISSATDSITISLTRPPEPIAGRVVINELNHNPSTPGSGFVEIHNTSANTAFDLSGYRLNGVGFTFPAGSVITPGGFLVIANDAVAFGEQYGFTIPVIGTYDGSLQNDGEALTLLSKDATGTNEVIISSVRYSDVAPWPSLADGSGASLQLIDPNQDASRVGNWGAIRGSATPGAANATRTPLSAFPPLWVNEVQPMNISGRRDMAGELDPWVELYNSGATPLSLNGLYLTDDLEALTKWAFPAGASIGAGQRLLIWLDGQSNQSAATELHTSFRSKAVQGSIALVGSQRGLPTVFDYLTYNQVPVDHSYGAYPEGQAVWRESFYQSTPAGPNSLSTPPARVFINEWMASNTHTLLDPSDLRFDDWFELYNAGSEAVDLGGYALTDDPTDPTQFNIPTGTIIPAHGHLLVWADNETATNGQVHANFRLGASGDRIALLAPDRSVVDDVTFDEQSSDVSYGRLTDGGSQIGPLVTATPGTRNSGTDPNALQFTGVTIGQNQVGLEWNSKPGETYRIEFKNNLEDPGWTLLRSVTTSDSTGVAADEITGNHRFYRLVE